MENYDPSSSDEFYSKYYALQLGNGFQVYKGDPYMGGNGIGSFFSGMMQNIAPVLKTGLKKGLEGAVNVATDILQGEDPRKSAIKRFSTQGENVLNDVKKALETKKKTPKKRKQMNNTTFRSKRQKKSTIFNV